MHAKWIDQYKTLFYGAFIPNLSDSFKRNLGAFVQLVWFVWAGVKNVNRTLLWAKQAAGDSSSRWVLVHFQADDFSILFAA